jgi:hypothetical protein
LTWAQFEKFKEPFQFESKVKTQDTGVKVKVTGKVLPIKGHEGPKGE